MIKNIRNRPYHVDIKEKISENNLLQRVYQARGISSATELEYDLARLLPYHDLMGIDQAVALLVECLKTQKHIMIIGDFDADGATSTAVAIKCLRSFGARRLSYLVPNRFKYGYGLTPEIVAVAAEQKPDLIMTVDNGISSVDGVETAKSLNIKVLITDHHLQGDVLPKADAIVNPNQEGDQFLAKSLAGVGVCFYLMLALRAKLRELDWFAAQGLAEPNMAEVLDLVALGTVADVVPLEHTNRVLVSQGIRRIRDGKCSFGIKALLEVSNKTISKITASDLGFSVGPRLNAAGRLDDMSLGIECLLATDPEQAYLLARELDALNNERRDIEQDMKLQAFAVLDKLQLDETRLPAGICLYDPTWHQGVIGIVAARVKDKHHRPVIAFAKGENGELKGSARSINGLHIRDTLDRIAKRHPELISKFGGHAMAAGLSLQPDHYPKFAAQFATEVSAQLSPADLQGEVISDGELLPEELSLEIAELLQNAGPWGQGFPEPLFDGQFQVIEQRIVGQKHLRLSLLPLTGVYPAAKKPLTGIAFNVDLKQWPNHRCQKVHLAYRLDINEYQGIRSVQLMIEHLAALV
ncbi:MAG: single-stranded-DNA-specific exonuclease RecJ [Gammaproteobacteria bacterium]|nr:single-stranded-DNA-specific exonuclease RecJ [Gammaproteobacteria bacterium]